MTLIDVSSLVQTLKSRGVTLERKPEGGVRVHSPHPLEPELLEAVKTYKLEILESLEKGFSPLNKPRMLERLPWELERLVSAASNGVLPSGSFTLESGIVPDLERYVFAWTCAYVLGDIVHAVSRLWEAHRAWKLKELN